MSKFDFRVAYRGISDPLFFSSMCPMLLGSESEQNFGMTCSGVPRARWIFFISQLYIWSIVIYVRTEYISLSTCSSYTQRVYSLYISRFVIHLPVALLITQFSRVYLLKIRNFTLHFWTDVRRVTI